MSEFIISKSLQRDIDYIKSRTATAKKCVFEIAWKLKDIADGNDLLDAGYKDIVEFAADNFGYSRSTTLNYVAISRKYLEMHKDAKDKPYLSTTCARIDDNARKVTEDYGIGQLNALGKTTADDFITMDSEGTISPSMTAKEIKEAVKKFYDDVEPEPDPEPDPEPEPEPDPEPEQDPEPEIMILTVQQIFLNCVTPIIDDGFETPGTDKAITANDIMQMFFGGKYLLHWILDTEDEIVGAELLDIDGNLVYTTNPENI